MNTIALVAVFMGCVCVYGVQGMIPLLGESINHPLFFFGPQNLIMLFDMNSTLGQSCFDKRGFAAMSALTGIFGCASDMAPDVSNGPPSLTSLCSTIPRFSACFLEESNSIAETCDFTEEQRDYIMKAVMNNQKITESLCENGGMGLLQFQINNGMSCAEQKRGSLLQCLSYQNPMDMMMYDREGCGKAKEFIECASAQMSECSKEAGDIIEDVMEDSLKEVCEMNEGQGQLPPGQFDMQEIGEGRSNRGGKDMYMKKQIELLEEIRDSLKSVVSVLLRHEGLLETIAEEYQRR